MAHSIFNTFSKRLDRAENNDIELTIFVEEVIDELLKAKRQDIFDAYTRNDKGAAATEIRKIVYSHLSGRTSLNHSLEEISTRVINYITGYYLIDPLIEKKEVTDIIITSPNDIWYREYGKDKKSSIVFPSSKSLETFVKSCVRRNGGIINHQTPIYIGGDPVAKMRMLASIPPANVEYPSIHFRIHRLMHTSLIELKTYYHMVDWKIIELIQRAIAAGLRILVAGTSGSGKTTFARAVINEMSGEISSATIEQVAELFVTKTNNRAFALVNRAGSPENSYTLSDYTELALIAGVKCICIGEIKGAEAWTIGHTYGTGHMGINTGHADRITECHTRFSFMASLNKNARNFNEQRLCELFTRWFDLIIFMKDFRVYEIAEVDYDTNVRYNIIYRYDYHKKAYVKPNNMSERLSRRLFRGNGGDSATCSTS